jgi:hypothetical protein
VAGHGPGRKEQLPGELLPDPPRDRHAGNAELGRLRAVAERARTGLASYDRLTNSDAGLSPPDQDWAVRMPNSLLDSDSTPR